MFKTDGSPHKSGVNGEIALLKFLNNPSNFTYLSRLFSKYYFHNIEKPFKFILKGGTQNRADLYCENNNISLSVKTKKFTNNKYHGTFDLLNTSMILKYTELNNFKFNKALGKYEAILKKIQTENITNRQAVDPLINDSINNILISLDGSVISKMFTSIHRLEKDVIDVIRDYTNDINDDISLDDLHFLDKNWLKKEAALLEDTDSFQTQNKSIRLLYSTGTKSPFRLRVALNNGITALLVMLNVMPKVQNKNSKSVLTFKIQVDDISYLVQKYEKRID
ncbi:hypothetical protein [Mycoplasmopsis verecunda]|uniref:Uncharacterized protein n=1 Tax=Mycoplasmopsis verecunda TaxID=171291 RepID=A0A1T4MF79_9BACT|nr:hypothetical protein [Mycoplasmopsis verecunda]WPB54529.1 hypothetical protein SAM46_03590 [Mycoplasmopsis verecunda]SJZ65573.1 hypothetical protein SAMN02745154_00697 [Mycoplasmopsis verecunda]